MSRQVSVGISLDDELLLQVDEKRGMINRSKWIEEAIKEKLK